MKRTITAVPVYGEHGTGNVEPIQHALLDKGYDVGRADDWFGDKLKKGLIKFQKDNKMKGTGVIPLDGGQTLKLLGVAVKPVQEDEIKSSPVKADNYFGAPWIGVRLDLLGRHESDAALNTWLVPEWKAEGLNYKTLVGNTHAWCSVLVNKKLRDVNVKGTNSAGAASHSKFGKKSPFWFGCTLPIQHNKGKGGRHVCFFLYWENEAKQIAVTMDGNRSNKYAINLTDLSGKNDILVGGPRWSAQVADGQSPTKAQVLAKYPFLVPGSKGTSGSTR